MNISDIAFALVFALIVALLIAPAWFHDLTEEEIREIAKDRCSE